MNDHTPKHKHHKHRHHRHHDHRAAMAHDRTVQPHDPNILENIGNGINYVGNGISGALTRGADTAANVVGDALRGISGAGGAALKAMQSGLGGDHDAPQQSASAEQKTYQPSLPHDAPVVSPNTAGFRPVGEQQNVVPSIAAKQEIEGKGKKRRVVMDGPRN